MGPRITPIAAIVKDVFTQMEGKKDLSKEDIEDRWKELAGEMGFKHSRPVTLRKGVLTVCVDTSVWMHEMSLRKRGLLKGLKRIFGKDRISGIHFRIGEF